MPTIVDRDATVALLRAELAAIGALCAGFDEDAWATPTGLPGWTVKDVLAHVVGTESMLLGHASPDVDASHLPHVKNPIGAANESWVESMRPLAGSEVLARFRAVTTERLAALDAMTQADFDAPSWTPAGPDETYGRFMRIRHYDCFLHEDDIRQALGLPERADPDHVEAALDEVAAALGFIAGKKAQLPAGSRVRLRLTGPVDRTYLISVTDRARVVDELDGEPTVGLELPAMLFLRLTGGREDAGPHLGADVALEGDTDLARQLGTHLAYTI
ncbi:MAG: maleylpyruvate isomerase family mycothiol-dependent enzyme [Acidimicrobiia bacterium]|nr:maleylpyruvate isomerase family mycothiol-dependent enzyme [Acidimicrobiia bacterium]